MDPDDFYKKRAHAMERRKEVIKDRLEAGLNGIAKDRVTTEPFLIPVHDGHYDWNTRYTPEEVEYVKETLSEWGWHVYPGTIKKTNGRMYVKVQSRPVISSRSIARRGFWSKLFNK